LSSATDTPCLPHSAVSAEEKKEGVQRAEVSAARTAQRMIDITPFFVDEITPHVETEEIHGACASLQA